MTPPTLLRLLRRYSPPRRSRPGQSPQSLRPKCALLIAATTLLVPISAGASTLAQASLPSAHPWIFAFSSYGNGNQNIYRAKEVRVIHGSSRIDGFPVGRSIERAKAAFGRPSSRAINRATRRCTLSWRRLGLVMRFEYFSTTACARSTFTDAVITGARWKTDRGLRIGASIDTMQTLYPQARQHLRSKYKGEWWLLESIFYDDCGGAPPRPYPGLAATVVRGVVKSFNVHYLFCE